MTFTREQAAFVTAAGHIEAVSQTNDEKLKKVYGSLCHAVPVFVLTDGLLKTALFLAAKANGDSPAAAAHRTMGQHLAAVIGQPPPPSSLLAYLTGLQTPSATRDLIRATRAVLEAATFYKQLAVAVLKVEAGTDPEVADDAGAGGGA